jgi:hypothetical protein
MAAWERPAREDADVAWYRDAADSRYVAAGTWDGEARRVRLLTAQLGVALDDETLTLYDVRDLMALQLRLQKALRRRARRPWATWRQAAARARLQRVGVSAR